MSILKDKYITINDDILLSGDSQVILDSYCAEFIEIDDSVKTFVAMFMNIVHDFFDHKIDEKTLSDLIHKSLFDRRTKRYHFEPYLWQINDVLAMLHEMLDITWIKEGANYANYLLDTKKRYLELLEKYEGYIYPPLY